MGKPPAKSHKTLGFTLIELMVAMMLMSLVTATCIWVFRQSLNIYQKQTGNAFVNQNWRIAMEKINQDLSACLPMSSGQQRFTLISRYADDNELGRGFARDYLSFATTTRVTNDVTTALVSYDITETAAGLPILWRYVQDTDNIGADQAAPPGIKEIHREVLAEYCTMFRIEYLWKDPRDVDPSGDVPAGGPEYKQVKDPGIFLSLHPYVNEDSAGLDSTVKYLTGGLNGSPTVLNPSPSGTAHAGTGNVLSDMYTNTLYGSNGVEIPFRSTAPNPGILEPFSGVSQWVRKRGKSDFQLVPSVIAANIDSAAYNRVIYFCSPNLWPNSTLAATASPLDITADLSMFTGAAFDTEYDDYIDPTPGGANPVLWPTYVPSQIRITMKIHNKSYTSNITRSKVFWIPSSGS